MNRKTLSKSLMALLVVFIGMVALSAFYVVPQLYWFFMNLEGGEQLHTNLKIIFTIAEILLAILAVAIVIIVELVNMFYNDKTYTKDFTDRLRTLSIICGISSLIIFAVGINVLIRHAVFPFSFGILAGILVVLSLVMIVGVVIALVRTIVMDAIEYKEENDLTV